MRWGVPIITKDETAEGLQALIQEVTDPEGLCIGKVHCDGGVELKGKFQALCESLGFIMETNAPYIPYGNANHERGFGTIIGTVRRLLLGAPHLPDRLLAEGSKAAMHIKNGTPSNVLDGKAPLEVWEDKKLSNLLHMHEWGALSFKHVRVRFRFNKLAARAMTLHLVGYNMKNKKYRQ